MQLAITAAETGQLVLATLHTASAPQTVDRIIDAFPDEKQAQIRTMLADSLRGVVAQRLVRRADGKGRLAAVEILFGTMAVASLIRERKTFQLGTLMQTGRKDGMVLLDNVLMQYVRDGADHAARGDPATPTSRSRSSSWSNGRRARKRRDGDGMPPGTRQRDA